MTSSGSDSISIIDVALETVRETIRIGSGLRPGSGIALTPDGRLAYVVGPRRIYVFEIPTTTLTKTIPFDGNARLLRISPDGTLLYVTEDDVISVLGIGDDANPLVARVPLAAGDLVLSPDGRFAYAPGSSGIVVIEAGTWQTSIIPIDGSLAGIALAPDGQRLYAAVVKCAAGPPGAAASNFVNVSGVTPRPTPTRPPGPTCRPGVTVIDPATGDARAALAIDVLPLGIGVSPDGRFVYVTSGVGEVVVIEAATNALVARFYANVARHITFSPDGSTLYLIGDNTAVIDTSTLTLITTIAEANGFMLTLDGAFAYASTPTEFLLIETATHRVVASLVSNSPADIATSPDGALAYVAARTILVIDTSSGAVVGSIPVAAVRVAMAPDGARLYAATSGGIAVIDTASTTVSTTIPLDAAVFDIAFSPDGTFAYAAYTALGVYGGVAIINAKANTVAAHLQLRATSVAVSPDGDIAYAPGGRGSGVVSVIGSAAARVIRAISLPEGSYPSRVVLNADGSEAYVTSNLSSTPDSGGVWVVRTTTGAVEGSIALGTSVFDIAITPDGQSLYVGESNGNLAINAVAIVDVPRRQVRARVPVGEGLLRIAIAPASRGPQTPSPTPTIATPTPTATPTRPPRAGRQLAYVANYGDRPLSESSVAVIDTATNTVTASIPVSGSARGIAITPDGSRAYVTSIYRDVFVIDTLTNTMTESIRVGDVPWSISILPNGAFCYVANFESQSVSVIATDSNAVVATIPLASRSKGIATSPDGSWVYAVGFGVAYAIDPSTNHVATAVPVGDAANAVAFAPDAALAYVTAQDASLVSIIDVRRAIGVGPIGVGDEPLGIAVSPNGRRAYVTHLGHTLFSDGSVSVVDTETNQVTATIPVGARPFDIAFTADGAFAYVTNELSDTLSVIDTSTNTVITSVQGVDGPQGVAIAFAPEPTATPSTMPTPGSEQLPHTGGSCAIASVPREATSALLLILPAASLLGLLRLRRRLSTA